MNGGCMRSLIALVLSLCFVTSVYAATVQITYVEPNKTQAGSPLTNLKETTIYYKQDNNAEQSIKVPASSMMGGGTIVKTFTVVDPSVCGKTTVTVQVTASNTNVTNFESVRSASVSATKDDSTASGCIIPNVPSGVTLTFQ